MKRVFAWVAALAMLISSSFNVMASSEVSISDGDLTAESATTKDVEVGVDKGSTFTVSVPIIPPINEESYKAMERSDGFFSDCLVTGDIASNEQIVVSVDEDVVLSPDGGLKDSVTWKAHTIPSASTGQDLNSTNIENGKTKTIGVKLSKDMPAGLWRGYLHVNVAVDTYGAVLTAEQFKTLIGNYNGEVNISIPKYVEIDGVQTLVRGIGEGALSGYPNLAVINLETDEEFYFEDSFKGLSTSADAVVINGNSNVVKVSGVTQLNTKITFSNCTLYVNGNPYVDSISDMIDMSAAQYVSDVHGSFTELSLNERSLFIDTDCMTNASVDKLVVPEFVFNCVKSAAFRGSGVKEVEVSNDIVGDSWFEGCKDLTKVVLKDGVTTIRDNAFSGCTNLTDVEVPETVTAIGAGAFDSTPFLDKIKNNGDGTINGVPVTEVKKKSELIYSEDGKTLVKIPTDFEGVAEIKDGVTTIADGAIEDDSYGKVTLVKIPSSVTSIEDDTLLNLNEVFSSASRIELASSNTSFWVVKRISLTDADKPQIGVTLTDCTYLMPATYRTVSDSPYPGVYKVYDDGVVGIEFNGSDDNAIAVLPMYTIPDGMSFTLAGTGEVVDAIYYNKWTNSVQQLKWYNATTSDYVEVDSLIADGSTYWVNSPAEGVLLFSVKQEPSDSFDFTHVNVDVNMWDTSSDKFADSLFLTKYTGDLAVRRGTRQVSGYSGLDFNGIGSVYIPKTVQSIDDGCISGFNEHATSIVIESENTSYVLVGNDTGQELKQKLVKPDYSMKSCSAGNTVSSRWTIDGVVRLQSCTGTSNVPVAFKPVQVVAGDTYYVGDVSSYVKKCEVILTDAAGSPITSFGTNGSTVFNVGSEVEMTNSGFLFVTPIFDNSVHAKLADSKCLTDFVGFCNAPIYTDYPRTDTLQVVYENHKGVLKIKDTCPGVMDGAFMYASDASEDAYSGVTDVIIPASVVTISDTELQHMNDYFAESERIHVVDGNKYFTVFSGKNGSSIGRVVMRSYWYDNDLSSCKDTKTEYFVCDGVVYSRSVSRSNTCCYTPIFVKAGTYVIKRNSSGVLGWSCAATTSSGEYKTFDGFNEDEDMLLSTDSPAGQSVTFTQDCFLWFNITWNESSYDSSSYNTSVTNAISITRK